MAVGEEREARPLDGLRVLVTRAAEQAGELASRIEAAGGEAVVFPLIQIRPMENNQQLDKALEQLDTYDWIIFTSVNTVKVFLERLRQRQIPIERLQARVAAVGNKTGAMLEAHGVTVDMVPKEYHAEGLLEVLLPQVSEGTRVLLPRSMIARNVLPEELSRHGVQVTTVDVYETVPVREGAEKLASMLEEQKIQLLTFTSSSTVQSFVELLAGHDMARLLKGTAVVSIGPQTSATCRKLGIPVALEARPSNLDGMIQVMVQWIQSRKGENADV